MAKSKFKSGAEVPEFPSRPSWQLQTAKARFSEVFRRTRSEGPQYVTPQGKEAVVILPAEEFERLAGRTRQPRSLVRFFAESPLAGAAWTWNVNQITAGRLTCEPRLPA